MATTLGQIETLARLQLVETSPRYWSSAELIGHITAGIKDLWRDIVDLKEEHFLTHSTEGQVFLPASSNELAGLPSNVHKIYLIEPWDTSENSTNEGLCFEPLEYKDDKFRAARGTAAIDPANNTIYYSTAGAGGPVGAPTIFCAPQVTSQVAVKFSYIYTIGTLTSANFVPIPGDCDNALVAWCIAYARAKESDDRAPDPNWLAIYGTEKQHLLQSLGLRNLQELQYVQSPFEIYWPQ